MKKMFFMLLILVPIFLTSACSKESCSTCNVEPEFAQQLIPSGPFYGISEPGMWQSFTVENIAGQKIQVMFTGAFQKMDYVHDWKYDFSGATKFEVNFYWNQKYYDQYGIGWVISDWYPI